MTPETSRRSLPLLRTVAALLAGTALAFIAGAILGEYPFQGDGIQWLPILGGAGLGAAMAWVVNRVWAGVPPVWMAVAASALAVLGEVRAVEEDTGPGQNWPGEGWAAIVAAGVIAGYGVFSARRSRTGQSS